jgi:hypothetical protein
VRIKKGFGKDISSVTPKGIELRRRRIFPIYLKKLRWNKRGLRRFSKRIGDGDLKEEFLERTQMEVGRISDGGSEK